MTDAVRISYNDIPHFARSTAMGHAGQLVMGNIGAWPGGGNAGPRPSLRRLSGTERGFPDARVFTHGSARGNPDERRRRHQPDIWTRAAGSDQRPHQFAGQNPLVGQEDPNLGLRFIDMTEAYSKNYRQMTLDAGKRLGIDLLKACMLQCWGRAMKRRRRYALSARWALIWLACPRCRK